LVVADVDVDVNDDGDDDDGIYYYLQKTSSPHFGVPF
jgi:hypothetical protein